MKVYNMERGAGKTKGPFVRVTVEVQERNGESVTSRKHVFSEFLGAGFPERSADTNAAIVLGSQIVGAAAAGLFVKHYSEEAA